MIRGALLLLGALALAGCGGGPSQQTPALATPPSSPAPASTAAAVAHILAPSVLASAKPTGQPCSPDSIDGNYAKMVHVAAGTPHVFRGWMLNDKRQPAGIFSLVLEGKQDYAISANTGASRPDVGAYLRNPGLRRAGFEFMSNLQSALPGKYNLTLLVGNDNAPSLCETGKTITIN